MKYYKVGSVFNIDIENAYVLSRNIGFYHPDNRLGANYDLTRYFDLPISLHGKEMKLIIRRMWKITIRNRYNKRDFSDTE